MLDATIELLLQTGQAKAVSIRSVAQRVGVTSPSIYLHFAEKDALLDAVCARYFEKLDAEMQRAAVGEQLVATGAASLPPSGCWGIYTTIGQPGRSIELFREMLASDEDPYALTASGLVFSLMRSGARAEAW